MRKIKLFLGVFLIVISIGGLLFWELKGRDVVLLEEVIVTSEDIPAGAKLDKTMFVSKGIARDNLLEGALAEKELKELKGKTTSHYIAKNSQITWNSIQQDDFYLKNGESIFVLQPHWISMRSSSLRRGDYIHIYKGDHSQLLGTYKVAFVKDSTDREVKDVGLNGETKWEENWLERMDGTAVINHIEIISTMNDYQKILDATTGEEAETLIIVQRGGKVD